VEVIVFGSLAMRSVSARWVSPCGSPSLSQRRMMYWSGVRPRWAMRWRKVWLRPYHARRSSTGRRLATRALAGDGAGEVFGMATHIFPRPATGEPAMDLKTKWEQNARDAKKSQRNN